MPNDKDMRKVRFGPETVFNDANRTPPGVHPFDDVPTRPLRLESGLGSEPKVGTVISRMSSEEIANIMGLATSRLDARDDISESLSDSRFDPANMSRPRLDLGSPAQTSGETTITPASQWVPTCTIQSTGFAGSHNVVVAQARCAIRGPQTTTRMSDLANQQRSSSFIFAAEHCATLPRLTQMQFTAF
jgi:hypothetical protein